MDAPQIRQFVDDLPHRAADLNAMGVAVMQLVATVNALTDKVHELEAALQAANKPASRSRA